MGLDAFVHCNCYTEGKTKSFPLPELEQYFGQDEDGHLSLMLDDLAYQEAHHRVLEWMEDACEHEDMMLIYRQIANWHGYSYFREALADVGQVYFPTLFAELPNANGGFTVAYKAGKMLEELSLFRELAIGRELPFLIDTSTGRVIQRYIAGYNGIFKYADSLRLGIDPNGFFIVPSRQQDENSASIDEAKILFRSMRFEQRFLEEQTRGIRRKVEYYDADTETRFVCDIPVLNLKVENDYSVSVKEIRLLHIEVRAGDASAYQYQLNALETVCKASIATGSPIVWC